MRIRSKAREIALCMLYNAEISKQSYKDILSNYFNNYPQKNDARDFSSALVEGVINNLSYLNSLIEKYVKNWEIERIAVIDRNIIRIG